MADEEQNVEVTEEVEATEATVEEAPAAAAEEPKAEATAENDSGSTGVEVSPKLQKIVAEIEELSVLDLSELVKALEAKFGVSAAAPMMVGAMPAAGGAGDAGASAEAKDTFDVILANGGGNKIAVIKAVREIDPSLGLKEAKDLVDGAPKPIKEGVGKAEADEAKKKLEEAGATVELK